MQISLEPTVDLLRCELNNCLVGLEWVCEEADIALPGLGKPLYKDRFEITGPEYEIWARTEIYDRGKICLVSCHINRRQYYDCVYVSLDCEPI